MNRTTLICLFLLLSFFFMEAQQRQVFDDAEYDPFFSLTLVDSQDDSYRLNGAAFYNLQDQKKYFLWVRRGTTMGIVTYSLALDRIASLEFSGPYGNPDEDYTPATMTLTDGSSFEVFVGTSGYLGGYDEVFGSFGRVYLNYNQVKSITFHHDGTYSRCPYCGTIFFDQEREICPFDQFELVAGNN